MKYKGVSAFLIALGLMPSLALASGFAVSDKSVSNLGRAFAGGAALPEDASILYNNPAGMQWLEPTASMGAHLIEPDIQFKSSTGATTNAGETKLLPNLYYVGKLGQESRFGLGVYSPFGLGIAYPADWEGRYHSIESDLKTINLSAGFSTQLNPSVAFGATLDVQYIEADLKSAVDFGLICYASLTPATCAGMGLVPGQSDGTQRLTGDNWSWGYSLGLLAKLNPATSLGVTYHSAIKQNIDGNSRFSGVPAGFVTFTDSTASVTLELPPEASVALTHSFSEALTVALDYTWTGWSSYDELRLEFDNTLPDSVERQEWDDSSRYGIGLNYRLNPAWLLRAGYSIDETPIPNAERRSPRVPDSDRRWYALGFNYAQSETLSIDVSYAYVVADDAPINNTDKFGHTLSGSFDNSFNYLSAQLNWRI